jgi:hypothetical protein
VSRSPGRHRGETLRLLQFTGDANNTLTWTDQHGHQATTQPTTTTRAVATYAATRGRRVSRQSGQTPRRWLDERVTTLAQWLAADQTRVTEVLRRRPDVEQPTSPATVDELANRLQTPGSLAALAGELPRPHLQAMEAVQAFGLGASRAELTALLARSGPDHEAMVAAVLDDLVDCAVIWPATQDRLQIAWGVGHLWPHPLGLGASVVELLAAKNVHELRQLALRQGLRTPPTRRADLQQAVADKLSDPSWVREQVDQAVPEVASAIIALAQPGAAERTAQEREELYHQLRRGRRGSEAYEAFAARQAAYQWAAALGLMLGPQYGHELYMPAEVGLALRGEGFRAPGRPGTGHVGIRVGRDGVPPAGTSRARRGCPTGAGAGQVGRAGDP